jgi:hypothetical protein
MPDRVIPERYILKSAHPLWQSELRDWTDFAAGAVRWRSSEIG